MRRKASIPLQSKIRSQPKFGSSITVADVHMSRLINVRGEKFETVRSDSKDNGQSPLSVRSIIGKNIVRRQWLPFSLLARVPLRSTGKSKARTRETRCFVSVPLPSNPRRLRHRPCHRGRFFTLLLFHFRNQNVRRQCQTNRAGSVEQVMMRTAPSRARARAIGVRRSWLTALSRAVRATFVGSMMPALNMSTYSPVAAL